MLACLHSPSQTKQEVCFEHNSLWIWACMSLVMTCSCPRLMSLMSPCLRFLFIKPSLMWGRWGSCVCEQTQMRYQHHGSQCLEIKGIYRHVSARLGLQEGGDFQRTPKHAANLCDRVLCFVYCKIICIVLDNAAGFFFFWSLQLLN